MKKVLLTTLILIFLVGCGTASDIKREVGNVKSVVSAMEHKQKEVERVEQLKEDIANIEEYDEELIKKYCLNWRQHDPTITLGNSRNVMWNDCLGFFAKKFNEPELCDSVEHYLGIPTIPKDIEKQKQKCLLQIKGEKEIVSYWESKT